MCRTSGTADAVPKGGHITWKLLVILLNLVVFRYVQWERKTEKGSFEIRG